MLSVLIATRDSERALVATLAALVSGAVAGLVSEVIIADAGSRDATVEIADAAGCRVLTSQATDGARLKAAADAARAPWLLFLQPGAVPDASWIDDTRRFIEQTETSGRTGLQAAAFRAASTTLRPLLSEALAQLRAALGAGANICAGLLIAKTFYDELGCHRDIDGPERDIIRRLGRRRIVLLRSTAG